MLCSGQQVLETTTIGGKARSPEHHVAGSLSCLRAEARVPQQHFFPARCTPRSESGLGSEKRSWRGGARLRLLTPSCRKHKDFGAAVMPPLCVLAPGHLPCMQMASTWSTPARKVGCQGRGGSTSCTSLGQIRDFKKSFRIK